MPAIISAMLVVCGVLSFFGGSIELALVFLGLAIVVSIVGLFEPFSSSGSHARAIEVSDDDEDDLEPDVSTLVKQTVDDRLKVVTEPFFNRVAEATRDALKQFEEPFLRTIEKKLESQSSELDDKLKKRDEQAMEALSLLHSLSKTVEAHDKKLESEKPDQNFEALCAISKQAFPGMDLRKPLQFLVDKQEGTTRIQANANRSQMDNVLLAVEDDAKSIRVGPFELNRQQALLFCACIVAWLQNRTIALPPIDPGSDDGFVFNDWLMSEPGFSQEAHEDGLDDTLVPAEEDEDYEDSWSEEDDDDDFDDDDSDDEDCDTRGR